WPLWYQFAAAAYGWDPATGELDATDERADGAYPAGAAVQLVAELRRIAEALDAVRYPELRVELPESWGGAELVADMTAAVRDDGRGGARVREDSGATRGRGVRGVQDPATHVSGSAHGEASAARAGPGRWSMEVPGWCGHDRRSDNGNPQVTVEGGGTGGAHSDRLCRHHEQAPSALRRSITWHSGTARVVLS